MKNIILLLILTVLNSCKPNVEISGNITPGSRNYVELPTLIDDKPLQDDISLNDDSTDETTVNESGADNESWFNRKKTLPEVYTGEIGVREKTGKNDGKDVEKYLKSTGLGKGNPWCAAFVHWCLTEAGIKNPITAYSPSAYSKKRIVWKNGWKKDFKQGQVFTLYYQHLGRIGHTGFVDRRVNSSFVETVEGNTNGEGSREGDGVYRKKRSLNSLYAICDWY